MVSEFDFDVFGLQVDVEFRGLEFEAGRFGNDGRPALFPVIAAYPAGYRV